MPAHWLQQLIDTAGPALVLYARQRCRAAEDAVQEAFVELVRQSPPPDNPVAWLYVAVRRRAANLARAESRRARHHRQASEQREMWFVPLDRLADDPIDIQAHLAQLPDLEREMIVARIWGEQSFAQIAKLVHQPLSTVHRRYQQALTQLARSIERERNPTRPEHDPRTSLP